MNCPSIGFYKKEQTTFNDKQNDNYYISIVNKKRNYEINHRMKCLSTTCWCIKKLRTLYTMYVKYSYNQKLV